MKKTLSILLAMVLLLTCIPLGAVSVSAATAPHGFCSVNSKTRSLAITRDTPIRETVPAWW